MSHRDQILMRHLRFKLACRKQMSQTKTIPMRHSVEKGE